MSNYSTGMATKERILSAAERVFYEKGFSDTKFADICREAGVLDGTLNHHFGSYKNVASELVKRSMQGMENQLNNLFGKELHADALIMLASSIYFHRFFEDEKFRKFNSEFNTDLASRNSAYKYYKLYGESIVQKLKDSYQKRMGKDAINEKELDLFFHAISSIDGPFETYLCNNLDDFTPETTLKHYYQIYLSIFGYTEDELNQLLDIVNQYYQQLCIQWNYFSFIIRQK